MQGVIDSAPIREWLVKNINPALPVLTPVVWTVTNLTSQRPEFFYRVPSALTSSEHAVVVEAIQSTVGADTAVREATPDLLIDSLHASTAIPAAFDPVVLPAPGGGTAQYVDGGVTANTPIGVARAFSSPTCERRPSKRSESARSDRFRARCLTGYRSAPTPIKRRFGHSSIRCTRPTSSSSGLPRFCRWR